MTSMTAGADPPAPLDDRVVELEQQISDEVTARKRLIDVAVTLNSTLDVKKLLQFIMASAAALLDAETSSLMLVDEDSGELVIEVATGASGPKAMRQRIPQGAGIAGWALANHQVAIVDDASSDERFFTEVGKSIDFETRNLLAVPLFAKDRPIGVVEVINKRNGEGFSDRDSELAGAFAGLAAIAIDNANLYAQLAEAVVTARMSYRF
ncbi:GAF domain-containing protein [Streptosporangiaceae bacterium NEAU-GS5]|nr:GAF domain-containing protein [Streptosporangiaceae bacterium NEAU-GS5]